MEVEEVEERGLEEEGRWLRGNEERGVEVRGVEEVCEQQEVSRGIRGRAELV